jgi:asparagine synthase
MFFTLAVSAVTAEACTTLTDRARVADPRIMPLPGPAAVVWRAADGRAAMLRWGRADGEPPPHASASASSHIPSSSHAGTIWVGPATPGGHVPVYARTSLTRVDPVYVAELPGAVIVSDRATWAAAAAGRLGDHDPDLICALLNPGFPLGATTPFRGIRALDGATALRAAAGALSSGAAPDTDAPNPHPAPGNSSFPPGNSSFPSGNLPSTPGEHFRNIGHAGAVASALAEAVAPLRVIGSPIELSLTGGKDSRLVAAVLVAAGIPVRAKTHGFADHPDVVVATEIARRLGIEHVVTEPAAPGQRTDLAARLRATVLVADGMLSAFENVGRPDPIPSPAITAGGHGGELLRGGYAEVAAGRRAARLRAGEALRRLTTRHIGLLRPGAAAGYLAGLAPWTAAALAHGPLRALDDFYLVNRAGRWSAAARQAYLLRERLVQPLFDERVVRAARRVPLADRVSGQLSRGVLAELCPALADVPFAGKPAAGKTPVPFDWRRQYGGEIAGFLRDYTLDLGTSGGLFDVVSRTAAEKLLVPPHADRATVWALATLACLVSGDYRNAREPAPLLSVS